jgi:hypothetical protein
MLIESAHSDSVLTVINPAHVVLASATKLAGTWKLHVEFSTGRTPVEMTDVDERRVRQFMHALSDKIKASNERD